MFNNKSRDLLPGKRLVAGKATPVAQHDKQADGDDGCYQWSSDDIHCVREGSSY